jgi:hypothetical protein
MKWILEEMDLKFKILVVAIYPKSKGYQKDPIQNLSFILVIFVCVCY